MDNGLHVQLRDGGQLPQVQIARDVHSICSAGADGLRGRAAIGSFDGKRGWYNQTIAVDPLNPDSGWPAWNCIVRRCAVAAWQGLYWWLMAFIPRRPRRPALLAALHPNYGQGTRRPYTTNDGGVAYTNADTAPVNRAPPTQLCTPNNGGELDHDRGRSGSVQFYTGTVNDQVRSGWAVPRTTALAAEHLLSPAATSSARFGGDGASVAIDPRSENTLYASHQNVNIHRSINGGNFVNTNGIVDNTVFIMPFGARHGES